MKFSERTNWDSAENDHARALRESRAAGRVVADLTRSNPTECGFSYDVSTLLAPLAHPGAAMYEPEARGMLRARKAVARYYFEAGAVVDVESICLTTSTSEAYSWLFRVLCDADDEVLIARPSYPLFDFIARLDNVSLAEYPLHYSDGWHMDVAGLERLVTRRTRAVIVVHPNNPTGNFVASAERLALDAMCARRGIALIVDEVFLDYSLPGVEAWPSVNALQAIDARSFAVYQPQALTFVLSGLSKVCGLPQMKISWLAACGPKPLVSAAMERLEIVADTFLSVNAPMQYALATWLPARGAIQREIRERLQRNLQALDEALIGTEVSRLVFEGGWTVVLRTPHGSGFAQRALERGVVVQPGELYGLRESRVVLSLLTPPLEWSRGLSLMLC
jgi:alanine-synthesizing transaminase